LKRLILYRKRRDSKHIVAEYDLVVKMKIVEVVCKLLEMLTLLKKGPVKEGVFQKERCCPGTKG
jgi:hypothetical protein